jgi:hypothetical protein
MRTTLISLLLFTVLAAPARAEDWLLPSDGVTLKTTDPVAFTVYLDEYDELPYDVDVVVARDAALTDVVARYEAEPLPTFPTIYSVSASGWTATPGTYYWQASYGDDVFPVRALNVVLAPPPDPPAAPVVVAPYVAQPPPAVTPRPPDAATARAIVRRAIAAATHRLARGLIYRCAGSICRPSWRDTRFRYRGTLEITTGVTGIHASFTGKRSGGGRPARPVTWSTAVT